MKQTLSISKHQNFVRVKDELHNEWVFPNNSSMSFSIATILSNIINNQLIKEKDNHHEFIMEINVQPIHHQNDRQVK